MDTGAMMDAEAAMDAVPADAGFNPDAEEDAAVIPDASDAGFADAAPEDAGVFRTQFQVVIGNQQACALFEDGRVKCWGFVLAAAPMGGSHGAMPNTMGQNLPFLDFGEPVRHLTTTENLTCAILQSGSVRCFGDSTYAEAGYRGDATLRGAQTPLVGLSRTATAVALGWVHGCALLDDHSVVCWGGDTNGQLGTGNPMVTTSTAPHLIDLGTGVRALEISSQGYFACALLEDHRVKCWGSNGNSASDVSGIGGNLGTGDARARGNNPGEMGDNLARIDFGTNPATTQPWQVKHVYTGSIRTCVILENDQVKCIGRNDGSPDTLGTGNIINYGMTPQTLGDAIPFVDLGTNPVTTQPWVVVALGLADNVSCALLENGRLKCWGGNALGGLGLGVTRTTIGDAPGEMGDALPFLDLGTDPMTGQAWQVLSITGGKYSLCARLARNNVKCWGYNSVGQLGLGDTQNRGDMDNQMGDALPVLQLE